VDLLLSTLRSLRAHALRFGLTSLGITWGAFVLTYLTSSMQGFDMYFTKELEEAGPKIVLVWPGAVLKNRVGERGARAVEIENEDVAALEALDSIEKSAPDFSLWSQIVRASGRTKLFKVDGISHESDTIRNLVPREGRFFNRGDVERAARVAYLGAVAADRLFGGGPSIGRAIQIESISFRVIGVNQAKGDQMVGMNGWDDWAVFIPYTTAQRWLVHSDKVEQIAFERRRAASRCWSARSA
jgi:putative ABC transport system permease protein